MQFTENIQANWQEGYCFIMTMPDPMQPDQPRRRIKYYCGNFFEHPPYIPVLAPSDIHLFGPLKATFVADVSLMMKRWKQRCGSG
jgi:hypothetical protein